MPAPRVAVVVVNWNGRRYLERCLPAIARQTLTDHQVLVVDNGSSDGSVAWLADQWPGVRVIDAARNLGFAAANNLAIEATASPWIALLNNDAEPEPAWLEALVDVAASRPDIGSVASLMVFADNPEVVNSAGIAADVAGIAWDRLGGSPVDAALEAVDVFGPSAGAALYRRAALEDVAETGLDGRRQVFDERFFLYLEDVDLAWRLRLRSWRCAYAPLGVVRHEGSASAGEGSGFKNRLLARNKVWTVVKNYPTGPLARHGPVVLAYDLASAPYRLLAKRQTAAFRGRIDSLSGLGECLRRRREIQRRRTVSWDQLAASLSPLEPPWVLLGRYRHLEDRST